MKQIVAYVNYNATSATLALFTHGKCRAVYINIAQSTFYFVFTLLSVWTGLYHHVSALAIRPVHIWYCIYTLLLCALYIFAHCAHARRRTSDWCFLSSNVLECYTINSSRRRSVCDVAVVPGVMSCIVLLRASLPFLLFKLNQRTGY